MLRNDRGCLEEFADICLKTRAIRGVPEGAAADGQKARQRKEATKHGQCYSSGEPPNVWRQWRAQRVHCTPGLGDALPAGIAGEGSAGVKRAADESDTDSGAYARSGCSGNETDFRVPG